MFEQLEELVQLRQDHYTSAAVGGAAFVGVIGSDGQIFTATGGRHVGRIETVLFLEDADDGGSAFSTEVPVVLDRAGMIIGFVIRMTFDHEFDIGLVFQDGGDLTENNLVPRCYVPFA